MQSLKEKTVRIGPSAHATLRQLAAQSGEPMQEILAKAIEEFRRKHFLQGLSADFAALRSDPDAWREEQEERTAWEATLADGDHDE